MRALRRSVVGSVVAAAGLSACINGPIDPVELIATDVTVDAERPEMSRLPDGSVVQRYIVVLRNDLLREGYVPGIVSELTLDNDLQIEHVYQHALGGFAGPLTPAQRARLSIREDVAFIVPDMPVSLVDNGGNNGGGNDPEITKGPPSAGSTAPPADWGLVDVLGSNWANWAGGNGVTVSVLDTGVDSDHPDLPAAAGCLGDFTGENLGCEDVQGHGTHVTGTIAMRARSTTAGPLRGIAPNASLKPGRVLNSSGSGSNAGIAAGINAARAADVHVINMSLGGPTYNSDEETDALCVAINNASADGTLVVVAAGNDARNAEGFSPARCDNALTVGAYDINDKLASFTNYGPAVDINAPGVDIASTIMPKVNADGTTSTLGYKSGTSMASPHAAAVAALYLEDNVGALPAAAMAAIVANSADRGAPAPYSRKITSSAPKLDGTDYAPPAP